MPDTPAVEAKRDHDQRNRNAAAAMAREILAGGDLYSEADRQYAREILAQLEVENA